MVPTTWTALLLLCIAVLPGATFTFGFERQASAYGVTLADRVLRFVAVSVAVDALLAWPVYLAYRAWFADRAFAGGQFAAAWALTLLGTVGPALLGSVVGGLYTTRRSRAGWSRLRGRLLDARREQRLLDLALGPNPAPRAWDHAFDSRLRTYLRVRTRTGDWIGGAYSGASYAGRFPQETDLWLEQAWPIDEDGTFGDGPLGYAVYIPAATIAHVEFVPPVEEAVDA